MDNKSKIEAIKTKNKRSYSLLNKSCLNNKYKAKTRIYIGFVPKTLFFLITLFCIPFFILKLTIDSFILLMVCEVVFFLAIFVFRIKVTPRGVEYRKKNFKWDQIKTIGIGAKRNGLPREFCHKFIYISRKEHSKPLQLMNGSPSKETQFLGCDRGLKIPSYLIITSFNRRLLFHIHANWDKDIVNIENVRGWRFYLWICNLLNRIFK